MTGTNPLVNPAAGGLVKIVLDIARAVGGSAFQSIQENRQAAAALKKYAEKYQSRYGLLKLLGMPQAVQLEAVYAQVRFLDDLSIRRFESLEALENAYRDGQRRYQADRQTGSEDGIAVANQNPYLMVLGGPGAGKSTFLRRLGLEALKGKAGQFQHRCIPVLLELKQFIGEVDLTAAIAQELQHFGFPPANEFATKALEQGKLLVLLDGLDEVPQGRVNAVIDAIQSFAVQYDQNRFVASCRIAAYRSGFQRFRDIELADFNDDQMRQFIGNWFSSALDRQSGTAQQCWSLLTRPENQAAKELAQTPLLLTFICLVYDRLQDLPRNRSSLYKNALAILLKEWAAEKRVQQDPIYQGLNAELETVLLAEIAYQGFVNDQLFFPQQQLIDAIKTFLADTVDNPKYLDGEKVLDAIAAQQGILVERAEGIFSFSHLTLQEYLTARYISQDYELIEHMVDRHLTDQRWREVFILVAGLRDRADQQLTLMDTAARALIDTEKLRSLLHWADRVTAGSEGDYNPAAKRAFALNRTLALTRARVFERSQKLVLALTHARSLDRTLDQSRNLVLALARTLDRALALTISFDLDRALARTLDLAIVLDRKKIFKAVDFSRLIAHLEMLKTRVPVDNQLRPIRLAFADQVYQTWLDALELEQQWLELSEQEVHVLTAYLYVNELMVRCKEAAVRVSREQWQAIEQRMLIVD